MAALDGKTALIVDDTSFMRNVLKALLESEGCKVLAEATDGESALALFKQHKPDFVTMDIVMPQMDGIAALKTIKQADPNAKVIMVSSAGQDSKVMEAKEAGASNFILKPFDQEKVIEIIKKVTG